MKVLSLFDGISCGRVALERAGIKVEAYYASEIDKHAINVSQGNYPDIIRLGDITNHNQWGIPWDEIDLVLGGSPCQSISHLGDGSGLKGKSGLFYQFVECLGKASQAKFLLENVKGKKDALAEITRIMGVPYVEINSNRFSAQNRKRLYWTDIPIPSLPDKGIPLQDILECGVPDDSVLSPGRLRWLLSDKGQATLKKNYATLDNERAACLTARSDASWNSNYVTRQGKITRLTPIEYERLQTLPDNYTKAASNTQRYKMVGNGWTVDVIAHILGGLNNVRNSEWKTTAWLEENQC